MILSVPHNPRTTPNQELRVISQRLKTESPADTVACAYGVGDEVLAWYDESDGRLFDLASLTKPLFTVPAVLELFGGDDHALDTRLDAALDWIEHGAGALTVRSLLQHSSGLPAELPLGLDEGSTQQWVRDRLAHIPPSPPHVVYSDVGYWLLGRIIAEATGRPLHHVFEREVAPDHIMLQRAPASRAVPAGPVEDGAQLVHDPAARALGDCGHAGSFGTLHGVVAALGRWRRVSSSDSTGMRRALTCQTHLIPGGHRSLAWTLAGDPFHVVAHDWPPSTLCHTGFTGVSVAWDPPSAWWAVLLTNALPVDRDATPVLIARRLFHALAARELGRATDHQVRGTTRKA